MMQKAEIDADLILFLAKIFFDNHLVLEMVSFAVVVFIYSRTASQHSDLPGLRDGKGR